MIGVIFSLMMMIISGILFCVTKLIFRFDLTNSLLVNGLIQILLRDEEWLTGIRSIIFFSGLAVGIILQHKSKFFRMLFATCSTLIIGILAYGWKTYDSKIEQWGMMIAGMLIGASLNIFFGKQKLK